MADIEGENYQLTSPEIDFTDVTEMAGEEISSEQLFRLANRYYWAGTYAAGKDVVEVACGTGPGLGYLAARAKSLRAGDYSPKMVKVVSRHYGDRVLCSQFDAAKMPFDAQSADVIIIFEALYYLSSPDLFFSECKRVLRPGGRLLVSTANPDLFDFNPSAHSVSYFGVVELACMLFSAGFEVQFWGSTPLQELSLRQKLFRPIKRLAASAGLIPKSMAGKRFLKRVVYGRGLPMPAEIVDDTSPVETPTPLRADRADTSHKVIYCVATIPEAF